MPLTRLDFEARPLTFFLSFISRFIVFYEKVLTSGGPGRPEDSFLIVLGQVFQPPGHGQPLTAKGPK